MSIIRQTKYTSAVQDLIAQVGHATNAELAELLRKTYPEVSLTTTHRVTARLLECGKISSAPQANDGAMRFDNNTEPHDHFVCNGCGGIRDLDVAESISQTINQALGGCKITGRLVIYGSCETCLKKGKYENYGIYN